MDLVHGEPLLYYAIAQLDYADEVTNGVQCYGPGHKAQMAAAETVYIIERGCLPEWGEVVEAFEIIDGSYLFIHRDPTATH